MNSQLPDIRHATLPDNYIQAQRALQECSRIDECVDWADKAHALASYAKQAKDETLERMAQRIKARAIRRCGQLLKQIEPQHGANQNISTGNGTNVLTRKRAASDAGMSKRQKDTALRVASVEDEDFEAMVESENPATVTELAEHGTAKQQHHPSFPQATHVLGTLHRFADFCSTNNPNEVAEAVMDHEIKKAKGWVTTIDGWLDVFVTNLEEEK